MAALFRRPILAPLACLLAGLTAVPSAPALLNIDGTRNQLFVFGGLTYGYSSNIFAQAGGPSDYTVTAQAGAELKRNAGLIAVNAVAKVDFVRYGRFSDENTVNPNLAIDLTKGTGRTTGTFSLQAYRETRSDTAVNLRTSSWNFPMTLTTRYALNQKVHLASATGYVRRNYDNSQAGLVDYTDYSEAVDLFYRYTSKLDLLAGYRLRFSDTSLHARTLDHWFNVGATGALFSKMTGTVRVGYQLRDVRDASNERFDHVNAQAGVTWPFTRKLAFTFQANRDFNTIATGTSVDSTSLAARAQYTFSRRVEFGAGLAIGRNDFLETVAASRRDEFVEWDVSARYHFNEHFQLGASYTQLHNTSSLGTADFTTRGFSLDISGRY